MPRDEQGDVQRPHPTTATLSADIAALDAAELATHTRALGTVEARDAKLVIVRSDLRQIVGYLQGLVDLDPANAATIAKNAGLYLKRRPPPLTGDLVAKTGPTSGSVVARARRGPGREVHEWQWSADGGHTWTAMPTTCQAKATLHGLQPGTMVWVRHRAITTTGPADWSAAPPVMVI